MRGGPVRGSPWVLGLFGDLCLLATLILAVQGDGRSALLAGAAGLVLSGAAPAAKSDHERSAQGLLPKPSDREMDERLAALLLDVDAAALRALHLVPGELITEGIRWSAADAVLGAATSPLERDGKPLLVITPVLDSRFAPGWDLGWRFTRWTVVALCPTPGHLGVFRCRADVVSGKLSAVETDEDYYADIVSVLTKGASTDGVLFAPVDHSVFGPREMPRLAGRELHLASPGTDRTLVKVAATAKKLHQRSEEDSRRTTEQLSIATYPTGVEEATAAVRSWLRATRRADSPR